jgi:hypothetical protein
MPLIDLRDYVVRATGTWNDASALANEASPAATFTLADTFGASHLMLRWPGDAVYLSGPLRVRVSFQAENLMYALGAVSAHLAEGDSSKDYLSAPSQRILVVEKSGAPINQGHATPDYGGEIPTGAASLVASTVYSYELDIAAGQVWPFLFREETVTRRLGANYGFRVIIEPAFLHQSLVPASPACDLPCDFAVADRPDASSFFPSACEPCGPAVSYGLPPGMGPTLAIPSADGGCVRTRFFNGMFITREDLETEQRYQRMKSRLKNRASGQGVVWGLNVGKQGTTICVLPGYGVDCCGNDLTVTTVYKVETATLLRDPAAVAYLARSHGPVRMHLLLEYVECPSEPRPVHADPCATDGDRCEASRIRETVRLRLIPPRDPITAGPIKKFLEQVAALRAIYGVKDEVPLSAAQAPFELEVTATSTSGESRQATVTPGSPVVLTSLSGLANVRTITVRARGSRHIVTNGTFDLTQDGTVLVHELIGRERFAFSVPEARFDAKPSSTMVYSLANWVAEVPFAPQAGPRTTGTTTLTFTTTANGALAAVGTDAGISEAPAKLADGCDGEPCEPPESEKAAACSQYEDKPAKSSISPWLHRDPINGNHAGDPKAVALAMIGGWVNRMMAREKAGTAQEEQSARRVIGAAIYDAAWLLLFGVAPTREAQRETQRAVQDLMRGWCERLLWKGPQCLGEPHGVVIGCTTVAAGGIGDVDPFGGRRWVLHAPLLMHWGEQVGLAPLDVTASRLFSTLCCVASLPAQAPHAAPPAVLQPLGNGYLAFGPPAKVAEELASHQVVIAESRTLAFAEFVTTAINAAQSDQSPPGGSTAALQPALRYTLGAPFAEKVLSLVVALPERDTSVRAPTNTESTPAATKPARKTKPT